MLLHRVLCGAMLLGAMLLGAMFPGALSASAPGQDTFRIPEALEDREFRRLTGELSEPDGFFEDENYVSNEVDHHRVLPELIGTVGRGGVYLGVGPEQNFTYISALEPRIAFVVDIRRQNMMEHLMYKALFEVSENRADFLSRLFSRPRPDRVGPGSAAADLFDAFESLPADPDLFRDTLGEVLDRLREARGFPIDDSDRASIVEVLSAFRDNGPGIMYVYRGTPEEHPTYPRLMNLVDESGRNWSYLGSEAQYLVVRDLQLRNLIVPVVGDFAGPTSLRAIGDYLRERGAVLDVFYASNVEPYLFAAGVSQDFYDSVGTLPLSPSSTFVRTFFGSAVRECSPDVPPIRTPVLSSIAEILNAYENGEITSQCALARRSR
jgi:hypothetical protein